MAEPWDMDWGGGDVDSYIQQASEKYGIPEDRLRAVVGAESNFDPNAVSKSGAEGLMQLMPATAKSLGVTDAFDPAQNIDAGARYLAQLKDQFGDWDTAHAAYNFGPGNVQKGKPLPDETKAYIAKINAQVADDKADQPAPWDMAWGEQKPEEKAAAAPWDMPWAAPQDDSIDKTVSDLAAMPVAERAARLAGGAIPGAAETAVQMLAQVPQMGTQVLGMVKSLAEGKTTKADFDQATQEMTPQWISDLANAKVLQPETAAGKLLSHGLGQLFEAAGEYPAAVGAGLKASIEAVANGEGTEGARKRFSDEYAKLAPVTSQLFNAALVGEGVHQAIKAAPGAGPDVAAEAPQVTPAEPAAPAQEAGTFTDQNAPARADLATPPPVAPAADPMQEAVQRAVDLTNETGVQHRARQVDGAWTAVPDQGAAPPADVLNAGSVDEAIAVAQRATEPLEKPAEAAETPEAQPVEATPVEVPPEALAASQEAPQVAPETAAAPEVAAPAEVPAERGVADMSPHEIDLALRLTRSEDRRAELQSELDRRSTETPNDQAPNPAEDVARNDAQPGAAVDAGSHDELAPAASAEGGPGPVDANDQGTHQLADGVAPDTFANAMARKRAEEQQVGARLADMPGEEVETELARMRQKNDVVEREAIAKFMPDKVAAYDALPPGRGRNRWLDENVTSQAQDFMNEHMEPEEFAKGFSGAAADFDETSPQALGRSIALKAREIDNPGFWSTPEGATVKHALRYAKEQGWNLDNVLSGMRSRAAEWAGNDAPELFARLFRGAEEPTDGAVPSPQSAPALPAPSFQDFTTPKGEVRTFASAKLAQAFAKTKAQGFTPRQVEGQWVLSRPEVVRTDAQKANDSRLSRQARVVQPEDDLATLLRKNGGINASELTRDGADPKDVAASLRFGAARKTGGMSLDGAAEVMASHGYDVHDEHGAIDATKARDLIQRVLDGERIFTPEGMEIRQQRAEANRQAGFDQDDEILRQADLPKEDGVEAGMVARASEIDESAVERLAIQYEGDDAGFVRAIREFLDDPNHETAARGEAASAEEARASEAAPDREGALARLKSAGEAVRNAKLGEAAALMPELEAARRNAEQAGITPIEAVQALQAPRRILTPEERLHLLPKEEESQAAPPKPEPPKETPAPAGVSLSEPRIEDVPPALLRRVTVPIDRYHEGEGVKTEQVAAHEALAEHDAEISAFEKLLECVRA